MLLLTDAFIAVRLEDSYSPHLRVHENVRQAFGSFNLCACQDDAAMILRLFAFMLISLLTGVEPSPASSSESGKDAAETAVSIGKYSFASATAVTAGLPEITDAARRGCEPPPPGVSDGNCTIDAANQERALNMTGRSPRPPQRMLMAARLASQALRPDLRPPILRS